MPGVQEAKASHKTQKVDLTIDTSSVSIQEVKDKLEDLGFNTE